MHSVVCSRLLDKRLCFFGAALEFDNCQFQIVFIANCQNADNNEKENQGGESLYGRAGLAIARGSVVVCVSVAIIGRANVDIGVTRVSIIVVERRSVRQVRRRRRRSVRGGRSSVSR